MVKSFVPSLPFAAILSAIACNSSPPESAEEAHDSIPSPSQLIARIEDSLEVLVETEGVLIAALEQKFEGKITLDHIYIAPPGAYGSYYLEGRNRKGNSSSIVSVKLVEQDGALFIDPSGKVFGCIPADSGFCIFTSANGEITGCDCVSPDTTSICNFIVIDDPSLQL